MYTSKNLKEYLLSTNEFNEPATVTAGDATGLTLVRLLLLQPGTNPNHPGMGVGLGPKYRFMLEKDMPTLQSVIEEQIKTYIPSSLMTNVKVNLKIKPSKYLLISIITNNISYEFDTENSSTPIQLSDMT